MPSLYIYYRVTEAELAVACRIARAMQQQICCRYPGLQTDLLKRPQAVAGVITLMEIYTDLPACCELVDLQIDIERSSEVLSVYLQSTRHVEVFVRP